MTAIRKRDSLEEYEEESRKLTEAWDPFCKSWVTVNLSVANMVRLLQESGFPYSTRTSAIQKIVEDHKHLKGFSRSTIYRGLPDIMKTPYVSSPRKLSNIGNVSNETFAVATTPTTPTSTATPTPTTIELKPTRSYYDDERFVNPDNISSRHWTKYEQVSYAFHEEKVNRLNHIQWLINEFLGMTYDEQIRTVTNKPNWEDIDAKDYNKITLEHPDTYNNMFRIAKGLSSIEINMLLKKIEFLQEVMAKMSDVLLKELQQKKKEK